MKQATVKAARVSGTEGDKIVLYESDFRSNRTLSLTVEEARQLAASLLVIVDGCEAREVLGLAGHVVKFGAALDKELNG